MKKFIGMVHEHYYRTLLTATVAHAGLPEFKQLCSMFDFKPLLQTDSTYFLNALCSEKFELAAELKKYLPIKKMTNQISQQLGERWLNDSVKGADYYQQILDCFPEANTDKLLPALRSVLFYSIVLDEHDANTLRDQLFKLPGFVNLMNNVSFDQTRDIVQTVYQSDDMVDFYEGFEKLQKFYKRNQLMFNHADREKNTFLHSLAESTMYRYMYSDGSAEARQNIMSLFQFANSKLVEPTSTNRKQKTFLDVVGNFIDNTEFTKMFRRNKTMLRMIEPQYWEQQHLNNTVPVADTAPTKTRKI